MSRRRRGEDFSHLLESFSRTTDCGSDLNTPVEGRLLDVHCNVHSQMMYENDQVVTSKSVNEDENSEMCGYKSTILAGQAAETESQGSTENSYQTARSGSTAEHPRSTNISIDSCRSEAPSLMNRAINNRFVPQSDLDLSQSTFEPRSSDELNRNIETSEKSSHDSRDTNYNIKNSPVPATSSDQATSLSYLRVNNRGPRMMASTPTDDDSGSKILKRFSQEFMFSPRKFTERLVTIIDETETGYENGETSGVNLSRMTREFRKLCKFIQDESMPEHMNSTLGMSRLLDNNKWATTQKPETIEESPIEVSSNNDFQTPKAKDSTGATARKVYRKTPINLFKKTVRENRPAVSPSSPDSTRNFVSLEKYLNEQPASPLAQSCQLVRSVSPSDISEQMRDKMRLVQKSEQQLASLDETRAPEFETFNSHPAHGAQEREIYDPRVDLDVQNLLPDYREINEDELSMSLRVELEKQRERCFETARQMQKIEEDAKMTNDDYSKVPERYGIDPEIECQKTTKSLSVYKNCWTRIRQYDNLKRNEVSSLDSGIDTRSISRTLHASTKKSCNNEASLKSSCKSTRNYETSTKYPSGVPLLRPNGARLGAGGVKKNDRKPTLTGNLFSRYPKQIDANARRRSPGTLCPTAKNLARSRSRSRDKSLPARREQSKIGTSQTPEASRRLNKNRTYLAVPEVIIGPAAILENDPNAETSSDEKQSSEKTPRSTAGRVKRPAREYLGPSPRISPNVRQSSKDRATKYANPGSSASPASLRTIKDPKSRFFVTPGKTVPVKRNRRRSKTFFPSMDADIQQEQDTGGSQRIMKSVHAPGIYRMGFNTVISPVSMYIRGTDMNLIQNVQSTTNQMLLTPKKAATSEEKLGFKLSAKKSTPRDSPRRCRVFTPENKNCESQSDGNDENEYEPNFALPKTKYELPAHVRTVDQSPKNIGGARARGLLQSMQNRVVIRHEGKIFKKYDDVPESGSDSVDMSIHVQRSAEKTNYMNRWK